MPENHSTPTTSKENTKRRRITGLDWDYDPDGGFNLHITQANSFEDALDQLIGIFEDFTGDAFPKYHKITEPFRLKEDLAPEVKEAITSYVHGDKEPLQELMDTEEDVQVDDGEILHWESIDDGVTVEVKATSLKAAAQCLKGFYEQMEEQVSGKVSWDNE